MDIVDARNSVDRYCVLQENPPKPKAEEKFYVEGEYNYNTKWEGKITEGNEIAVLKL